MGQSGRMFAGFWIIHNIAGPKTPKWTSAMAEQGGEGYWMDKFVDTGRKISY